MLSRKSYWLIFLLVFTFSVILTSQSCRHSSMSGNGGGYTGIKPDLNLLVGKSFWRMIKSSLCDGLESKIDIVSTDLVTLTQDLCSTDNSTPIALEDIEYKSYNMDFIVYSDYKIYQYQPSGESNSPPFVETFCIGDNLQSAAGLSYDVVIQERRDGSRFARIYGGLLQPDGSYEVYDAYSETLTSRSISANQIIYETPSFRLTIDKTSADSGTPKYLTTVQGRIYGIQADGRASCIIQNTP